MPTIISGSKVSGGIYRAVVIEFIKDSVEGKTLKSARVYIPALHREQMPFNIDEEGVISGCIFDESNESQLNMSKYDYPIAQICSWNVCAELKVGDPVWIIFENGDIEFPIIVGSLGSSLPEISQVSIEANPMVSSLPLTNDEFVDLAISLIAGFESGNEFIGLKSGSILQDPFTLGYIGFTKYDAAEVIKTALNLMTEEERKKYDSKNELFTWVSNVNILTTNLQWWTNNVKFYSIINEIVTSEKGIEAQETKAKKIVKGYISKITENGITDPKLSLYLADIMNQYGKEFIKEYEYEEMKNKSLEEVNEYWKASHTGYHSRRDSAVAKINEFESGGKLTAYMSTAHYNGPASAMQQKVAEFARTFKGEGAGANSGYCQLWVAQVYQKCTGKGNSGTPDYDRDGGHGADDAGRLWGISYDTSNIPLGAAVWALYEPNGHAAIYIGEGKVASNIKNPPNIETVESFKSWASKKQSYQGLVWGWQANINLSKME